MYDNYSDACDATVTREQAQREINRHGCLDGWKLFLTEAGDKPTYTGKEVLDWLGY